MKARTSRPTISIARTMPAKTLSATPMASGLLAEGEGDGAAASLLADLLVPLRHDLLGGGVEGGLALGRGVDLLDPGLAHLRPELGVVDRAVGVAGVVLVEPGEIGRAHV